MLPRTNTVRSATTIGISISCRIFDPASFGPFGIRLGQQDGELVAAKPCHGVRLTKRGTQPRRHDLQHLIAGVMSERVVDVFEAVEIENQQRQRTHLALGLEQPLVQSIVKQGSVREVGQLVVKGEIRHSFAFAKPLSALRRLTQTMLDGWSEACKVALGQVILCTDAHRVHGGVFAVRARDENERQVPAVLAHQRKRVRSGHGAEE